ncbi:HER124Cp [Eremothecium sinecaudum]|uniref:mRNA-capping enzyme subunit beta n=1 Tax=Eremothecium sinecaudum TaxID=45286 RepID=A0A109UZI0_9SACH|nr:HER124Cp [Eremothecium sinecaudum]AMD21403.1 HER124Cp [Eremothecium sinecaudum]
MSEGIRDDDPRQVASSTTLVNKKQKSSDANDTKRRFANGEDFSSNSPSQIDDETDTDAELGEVAFDQNDFKFDFEQQEKQTSIPDGQKAVSAKKDNSADTPGENSEREEELNSEKVVESNTTNTARKPMDIFDERASLESKKNNLKKDLKILHEIASTAKPSRYKVAPIWAHKWKPTVKALQSLDRKDFTQIDVSFTQVIPDDDLTKSVQDWIYATVLSVPEDQRQFIELEMKFGMLMDGGSDSQRVSPPVSSQTVYTEMDARMKPDVDERVFFELNRFVKSISELNENTGKFNIIESHTKDELYRVGVSTQRPRFLRMSKDVKTGRVGAFIEKKRISHLLLFSPKDSYDVKMSINLELPVPENDPPEKYKDHIPISARTKERISYIHNDSCTRIDITKVSNHNQGVKKSENELTHEIELELNTQALLSAFDKISHDSKEYATIVRTFLNNGTIIRRKLTSLSYEIFEGSKKL